MNNIALELASWASKFEPSGEDLELADRSLRDTVAVTIAARDHEITSLVEDAPEATRWATIGHVLDFDDLHMESTAHISVVCVPAALESGGGARAYLAAAGTMARLGTALGWAHYERGWHATCTAGAPAAAVAAAVTMGLDADGIARAMALAIPGAGGVQRAFGTSVKSLQVGFATGAGLRAAQLAARGASADPSAVDQWFELLGGDVARLDLSGPAVPGGLAIKLHPCCYALQRPIAAVRELSGKAIQLEAIEHINARTMKTTVQPLIHSRPASGLEGKFSLEYSIAATLADGWPGFESFTDEAVLRPDIRELLERIEVETTSGGTSLLSGEFEVELTLVDGTHQRAVLATPPGAPTRPPSASELELKLSNCAPGLGTQIGELTWDDAAGFLRRHLARPTGAPGSRPVEVQ